MPSQKLGTARKSTVTSRTRTSTAESRFRALTTPTGMPTSQETRMATAAISMVIGARFKISTRMGSSRQNDLPRSPRKTSAIHDRYWTYNGLSRPRLTLAIWTCSGVSV